MPGPGAVLQKPLGLPRLVHRKAPKTPTVEGRIGCSAAQCARLLGINLVKVWNRMRKYGIDLKRVLP